MGCSQTVTYGDTHSFVCVGRTQANYEESKATRLLADALGGNARTLVLATFAGAVTPACSQVLALCKQLRKVS